MSADFYGPALESEPATLRLFSVDLGGSFKTYQSVFETDLSAPPSAQFRIWNTSGYAIRVRNIGIRKLQQARLPVSESSAQRIAANGGRPYKLLVDQQGYSVYENLNAQPRIFCTDQMTGMGSRTATLQALLAWQVNPARRTLFSSEDLVGVQQFTGESRGCGTLNIKRFTPGIVDIDVKFPGQAVVVFSEAWDSRWHAYLDDVETPDLRVDYFAQGVIVKPGTRKIQFRYRPFRGNYGLAGPPIFVSFRQTCVKGDDGLESGSSALGWARGLGVLGKD